MLKLWMEELQPREAAAIVLLLFTACLLLSFLGYPQEAFNNASPAETYYEAAKHLPHKLETLGTIAAIIAAVFTGLLAYYANLQFVQSRQSAEIQLRAYVFVSEARIDGFSQGNTPTATVSIKNYGQTPADNIAVGVRLGLQPYPLTAELPDLSSDAQRPLGPGDSFKMRPKLKEPLKQTDFEALNAGTQALYIVGCATYKDKFGNARELKFCLFSGTEQVPLGMVSAYPTGNTYT